MYSGVYGALDILETAFSVALDKLASSLAWVRFRSKCLHAVCMVRWQIHGWQSSTCCAYGRRQSGSLKVMKACHMLKGLTLHPVLEGLSPHPTEALVLYGQHGSCHSMSRDLLYSSQKSACLLLLFSRLANFSWQACDIYHIYRYSAVPSVEAD